MTQYGRIVSAPMVEWAVLDTIRTWMPAYLGEVMVQAADFGVRDSRGQVFTRTSLADPRELTLASDLEWESQETGLVVVVSPGTTDVRGDGAHLSMVWDVRATAVVSMPNRLDTRMAAQFYAAALATCLAHKQIPSLDGAVVDVTGESYRLLAERDARTLMAAEATLRVEVGLARARYGGPDTPPETGERPPGSDVPTVVGFHSTIRNVPVNEPLEP